MFSEQVKDKDSMNFGVLYDTKLFMREYIRCTLPNLEYLDSKKKEKGAKPNYNAKIMRGEQQDVVSL